MTVPDGSQVRLASVMEVTPGTTPSTPSFKTMRYVSSDLKPSKKTETPDEVTGDGNMSAPVDVGQTTGGTVNCLLSYGTFDDWLSSLFRAAWASNVLKNGITPLAVTLEEFFEQGTTDTFIRYPGTRINTLDLVLEAGKSVQANFGVMGLESPDPTGAIISGATYAAQTSTEVFNAALNVASLTFTGIATAPVIQRLSLKISSGVYENNAVALRGPHSHGFGNFNVSGSFDGYFQDKDTFQAIKSHTTVGLAWELEDAAGNSYLMEIPSNKLMDGGPAKPGNGKAVTMPAPFQAFKNAGIGATMRITRTPA